MQPLIYLHYADKCRTPHDLPVPPHYDLNHAIVIHLPRQHRQWHLTHRLDAISHTRLTSRLPHGLLVLPSPGWRNKKEELTVVALVVVRATAFFREETVHHRPWLGLFLSLWCKRRDWQRGYASQAGNRRRDCTGQGCCTSTSVEEGVEVTGQDKVTTIKGQHSEGLIEELTRGS